ncbi:uncharacterized protein BJ171DRAFT_501460 [Polychytrium aggregatum]|uniref:uncharacterized protein n=1 Tax=Polychytrium aggregatum TaxID=110093 RepID=UPI0022FECDA1|nr:uncharacterized protein BJ171DRAFT_501460 [Polychytrium aggregatum]KAI9205236.1 hypothetical protein BJ171DRAFT_501460 [Polychytrium aggregatum]
MQTLDDLVVLAIMDDADEPHSLASTCRRFWRLWSSSPATKVRFLLRRFSPIEAIERSIQAADIRILQRILPKTIRRPTPSSSLWLAHFLVDLTRSRVAEGPDSEGSCQQPDSAKSTKQPAARCTNPTDVAVMAPQMGRAEPLWSTGPAAQAATSKRSHQGQPTELENRIRLLLHHGADLNADMRLYLKSLLFGDPLGGSHFEIARLLEQAQGRHVGAGTAAVFFASLRGMPRVVDVLVAAGVHPVEPPATPGRREMP